MSKVRDCAFYISFFEGSLARIVVHRCVLCHSGHLCHILQVLEVHEKRNKIKAVARLTSNRKGGAEGDLLGFLRLLDRADANESEVCEHASTRATDSID